MREGAVEDEPLSKMPHFMGYFSARNPPQPLNVGNYYSRDRSAPGSGWKPGRPSPAVKFAEAVFDFPSKRTNEEPPPPGEALSGWGGGGGGRGCDNVSLTLPQL